VKGAPSIARLSALGRRQLGLFTRDDARVSGVDKERLRWLVERGLVERVAPSVFRFTASEQSWHQRVLTAVLDGGPECLASHRTAAVLHGFDGFRPDVVEVVLPMRIRHRRRSVVVHHSRALTARDRAVVDVIPVTSRARALIDLGAVTSADRVEEAFDGAERDRLVRRGDVENHYAVLRARGRNGIGAMTQILDGRAAEKRVPRSVLERRMMRLLAAAGLPAPIGSYRVRLSATVVYELDFAYVDCRLGLEVDGHGSHATRHERADDNVRANALSNAGWTLCRFTFEQVMHDPASVGRTVRAALAGASF
jgi:very-short-patch-repair endonuclease